MVGTKPIPFSLVVNFFDNTFVISSSIVSLVSLNIFSVSEILPKNDFLLIVPMRFSPKVMNVSASVFSSI